MTSKREKQYYKLGDGKSVSPSQLRKLGKEKQKEVMRSWFLDNYSDPLILPYDSAEGGYQWIWGGPFDAGEELGSEFGGTVKESALEELADELSDQNSYWSANPDSFEPEEEAPDLSTLPLTPYDIFEMSLSEIEEASRLKTLSDSEPFIQRLLFANVITALETYLADRFRLAIKDNPELIQKFIETDPKLKDQKISLSAASATARNLEKLVLDHLGQIIWHRLEAVGGMYLNTLGVQFPKELGDLYKAILGRHDIVHRNGKSTDGQMGTWSRTSIIELIIRVRSLAKHIEDHLRKHWKFEALPRFEI